MILHCSIFHITLFDCNVKCQCQVFFFFIVTAHLATNISYLYMIKFHILTSYYMHVLYNTFQKHTLTRVSPPRKNKQTNKQTPIHYKLPCKQTPLCVTYVFYYLSSLLRENVQYDIAYI